MEERDPIYREIMERGWNADIGAFVQSYDSEAFDAANLIMPLVFFVSLTDLRMLSTIDRTLEQLSLGSLVYRYENGKAASGWHGQRGRHLQHVYLLVSRSPD